MKIKIENSIKKIICFNKKKGTIVSYIRNDCTKIKALIFDQDYIYLIYNVEGFDPVEIGA